MWHVYYRGGYYLLPIVARTDAGFFLDIEPVAKLPRGDVTALAAALDSVLSRENPKVAAPGRGTFPKPVVLEPAGVKTWGAFEKKAICWTISRDGGAYVVAVTGRAADGRWADAPESTVRVAGEEGSLGLASAVEQHQRSRSDV